MWILRAPSFNKKKAKKYYRRKVILLNTCYPSIVNVIKRVEPLSWALYTCHVLFYFVQVTVLSFCSLCIIYIRTFIS